MKCKYCGKNTEDLMNHDFNGQVCENCDKQLWEIMSFKESSAFESVVNRLGLNDAFIVLKTWLDREFSIVRFYEFKEDSRLRYDKVLVYIAVKEMDMGCKVVKFPVILEVRAIGGYNKGKLKVTMKDDTKSRDFYITGRIADNTMVFEGKDIHYVKTDMNRVERELKEFLK